MAKRVGRFGPTKWKGYMDSTLRSYLFGQFDDDEEIWNDVGIY